MIPNTVMPNGQDTIRTTDGFQCSQAVAPSAYMDGGMYSNIKDADEGQSEYGLYVRVVIPIGGSKDRINCKELYDFELRHREKMKALEGLRDEIFN